MRISARILTVSVLSLALLPLAAIGEDADDGAMPEKRPEMTREERRAAWDKLSEEEKEAKREQMRARREEMRARWESMTPEEREAKKAEIRKRMESMTPEEREAMRKRRSRQGSRGDRQGEGKTKGN